MTLIHLINIQQLQFDVPGPDFGTSAYLKFSWGYHLEGIVSFGYLIVLQEEYAPVLIQSELLGF